jgi:hypothetical protein
MTEIVLHKRIYIAIMVVQELRSSGLVNGVDFDFKCSHEHTTFTFYNDEDATMFALRYT